MSGKDPSMPLYVNDWLSSSRVQAMTPSQELAYFRLCLFCWSSQDASLPDDDEQLMRMSRWPLKGGSRVVENGWTVVRGCFKPHPLKPGYLTNERVLELWEERQIWREKSRIGGKNSAAKRSQSKSYANSKGGSTTLPTKRQPNGNSSSSSSSSLSNTPTPFNSEAEHLGEFTGYSQGFSMAWACWPANRRAKKVAASAAWDAAIARISFRFEGSLPKAEEWLFARVRAYTKSPKASSKFCSGIANWLIEGDYDASEESWQDDGRDRQPDEASPLSSSANELQPIVRAKR